MSRYIDADKMLEACTKYIASVFPKSYEFAKQDAELLIATEPSIDIVRCKECRYYVSDGGAMMICDITYNCVNDDDYCNFGEREGE